MKNLIILLAVLVVSLQTAVAQKIKFGIKVGTQTETQQFDDINIMNDTTNFTLGLSDRKLGFHGGIWARFGDKFFFQPELLLNTNSTEYKISDVTLGNVIKTESYLNLDFPLMVGVGIGPLRLYGGPVGHVFLQSQSQLTDIKGYSQTFDAMNWGWQAGLGIGRGRFAFDLRYEGNTFKNDHYTFFGNQYQASGAPSRIMASVSIALKK